MALVMRRCVIFHVLARPVGAQGNDHDGRSELEECSAGGRARDQERWENEHERTDNQADDDGPGRHRLSQKPVCRARQR